MGEIIECIDLHLQRRVIIKRLQADIEARRLLESKELSLRFVRNMSSSCMTSSSLQTAAKLKRRSFWSSLKVTT